MKDGALSPEEAKWVRDLQRVLLRAPARFALVTIGDRALTVIDAVAAGGSDLHDGRCEKFKVATVRSACPIHGVSG